MIAVVLALAASRAPATSPTAEPTRPPDFVYLRDVAPSIVQDMRYAGYHNFLGRPVAGYRAAECILTRQAAEALAKVQAELEALQLTLHVYDCYRPQRAVNDFIAWSKIPSEQTMKAEFYPRVDKALFFKLGYVAAKSRPHARQHRRPNDRACSAARRGAVHAGAAARCVHRPVDRALSRRHAGHGHRFRLHGRTLASMRRRRAHCRHASRTCSRTS